MTDTAQLNLRIPVSIKTQAQIKAEKMGTNINFLVKLFLSKFITEENMVTIKQDIKIEKIFDKGFKEYFASPQSRKTSQQINKGLEDIIKEEKKYLV